MAIELPQDEGHLIKNHTPETYKAIEKKIQDIKESIGLKYDSGKLPMELLPFESLEAVAEVLGYGAKKYAPNNWQLVSNPLNRYTGALLRHLSRFMAGENIDPESGLPHLSHVATNALFILWFYKQNEGGKNGAV